MASTTAWAPASRRAAFSFMRPVDPAGNIGRNTFRKGGIRNVNAALARAGSLTPQHRAIPPFPAVLRDLALVVGPLEHTRREQDGLTVNAYVLEENAGYTQDLLEFTVGQLGILQDLIGLG